MTVITRWSYKRGGCKAGFHCISSNNSRRRLLCSSKSHYGSWFFAHKGGDYSREAIILNIAHWKSCPKYFVLVLQIWFLDYFSMSISSALELESSLMSFVASDSTSTRQGGGTRKRKWRKVGGGGIIRVERLLKIFPSKGGD